MARYLLWGDGAIVFQPGPGTRSGEIVVHVGGEASNGLPFAVRPGGVYFVTPGGAGDGSFENPFAPADYVARLAAGEDGATAYFRAGTYDGVYGYPHWHANFCLGAAHSGEPGRPNAFVAYPGEEVWIRTSEETGADRSNFRIHSDPATYVVVSKLHLWARNGAVSAHTGWRVVGNRIEAIHETSVTGAVTTTLYQDATSRHIAILGNEILGGSSGNKLDHAIYPGAGTSDLEIAWNYIHDNDFANGPMISLNCNDAAAKGLVSRNVRIHSNVIDVRGHPSRAIGVYETAPGSTVYVYNNLVLGPAPGGNPSVYAASGELHYANNTLVGCGAGNEGACFHFYTFSEAYTPQVRTFRNNLVVAGDAASYYLKRSGNAVVDGLDHNLFTGVPSPKATDLYLQDAQRVEAPPGFVAAAAGDYRLSADSSARDAGAVVGFVAADAAGTPRPQGAAFDIGAYEYAQEGP